MAKQDLSSEVDSDMSGRQKQPVELLKAVIGFGTLFMIAEGDLPCAGSENVTRPYTLWRPFTPIVCQH